MRCEVIKSDFDGERTVYFRVWKLWGWFILMRGTSASSKLMVRGNIGWGRG